MHIYLHTYIDGHTNAHTYIQHIHTDKHTYVAYICMYIHIHWTIDASLGGLIHRHTLSPLEGLANIYCPL